MCFGASYLKNEAIQLFIWDQSNIVIMFYHLLFHHIFQRFINLLQQPYMMQYSHHRKLLVLDRVIVFLILWVRVLAFLLHITFIVQMVSYHIRYVITSRWDWDDRYDDGSRLLRVSYLLHLQGNKELLELHVYFLFRGHLLLIVKTLQKILIGIGLTDSMDSILPW